MNNPNVLRELFPAFASFTFIFACMAAGGYGVPILNDALDLGLENPTGAGVTGGTFFGIIGSIVGLRTLVR
jgi:hypothetical protein